MVRLDESWRTDIEALRQLPVTVPQASNPELQYVPLGEIADVELTVGPNQINRESGKRNVIVSANVVDRDLGSFVGDCSATVTSDISLPTGYWIDYGGTFEQL